MTRAMSDCADGSSEKKSAQAGREKVRDSGAEEEEAAGGAMKQVCRVS